MQPEIDFPSDLRALEHEYEILHEIGHGGMAAVYLARRRSTGSLVAIKAIRSRYVDDPEALSRFAREARTVAGLSHPNIVRTDSIEQIEDRAVAIIMEYVPGGTVRDRLREYGAFSAEDAEAVLRDVGSALQYAHRRRIVHRDVKPENVFLDRRTGRALLSDFHKQKHEALPPITSLRPRVPANLLFAIEHALVKDRERRWQGVDEFLERLTYDPPPLLSQDYPAASPRPDDEPTIRFRRATVLSADEPFRDAKPNVADRETLPSPTPRNVPAAATPVVHETPAARGDAPRWRLPAFGRGRLLRVASLLAPLAVAIGVWYVLILGNSVPAPNERSGGVTTSAGTIALDTAAAPRDTATATAKPPAARAPQPDTKPVSAPSRRQPVERVNTATATSPSPRCSRASTANQRACLLAYIARNDASLQRTYDSLIVELRRSAGLRRGASDPPAAARLRAEQRAWVATRDRECTRQPALGSVPLWAQPLADCFARVSAAREKELSEMLRRARQETR